MAMTAADVMKMIKREGGQVIDLRFTDTRGKEQHVSVPVKVLGWEEVRERAFFRPAPPSLAGKASKLRHAADARSGFGTDGSVYRRAVLNLTCDAVEPSDGRATTAIRAPSPSAPRPT